MESIDINQFLAQEPWFQQFVHSGVPTRTTPTLTPTTLRNIEQTFIELQCDVTTPSHQSEAGFVPPIVLPSNHGGSTYMSVIDSKSWQGGVTAISHQQPAVLNSNLQPQQQPAARRNMGGRRPNKNSGISPEEEERRNVRRERNKMAAARCRKRRMDHTNELLGETEGLQQKKQSLEHEIQTLQMQKEELEFILEHHKSVCPLEVNGGPRVKTEPMGAPASPPPPPGPIVRRQPPTRPTSLSVQVFPPVKDVLAGIPITTPSSGLPFNFDSMMEGGTGLTPVSVPLQPSCRSLGARRHGDLKTPEHEANKLVAL